jgi:hypothetical protein
VLLDAAAAGMCVGTADLSLAFDRMHPALAVRCFEHYGLPACVVRLLRVVWESQTHLLQLAGETLLGWRPTGTSLPHGDPWSPLALTAALAGALRDIRASEVQEGAPQEAAGLQAQEAHCLYIDDRSWAARDPTRCVEIGRQWSVWAGRLGLLENEKKLQFLGPMAEARRELLKAGAPKGTVAGSLAVFGAVLRGVKPVGTRPKEAERLAKASRLALRCSLLPLEKLRRCRVALGTALPVAAYGWVARTPAQNDLRPLAAALRRVMGDEARVGSPHLRAIFWGHGAHAAFAVGASQIVALWRGLRQGPRPAGSWEARAGWSQGIRPWMRRWGWRERGEWEWKHPGTEAVICLRSIAEAPLRKEALEHNLREGWRQALYARYEQSGRRGVVPVPYSAARCAAARKLATTCNVRAVLCGAVVSPAAAARMGIRRTARRRGRGWGAGGDDEDPATESDEGGESGGEHRGRRREVPQRCAWCGQATVPNLDHVYWHCPAMPPPEGGPPADQLQRRLGWPLGGSAAQQQRDRAALHHMAAVRARLLQERWGTGCRP